MYVFCLGEPARVEPGLSEAQIQDTNNMFDTEIFFSYGFRRDTRRLVKRQSSTFVTQYLALKSLTPDDRKLVCSKC